jgi:type VI secretion system secreted protein Hcp
MALVDYFLKIEGIQGESPDKTHKGEIQLESFSWGATNSGTGYHGGGSGAGKVSMQDFHFLMKANKASPKLMLACAQGDHIPSAILICRKAGGKDPGEFLKITFTSILVASYQTGGSAGDVIPMDQISLNFAKIELEYKEQKADGTLGGAIKSHYDLKAMDGG